MNELQELLNRTLFEGNVAIRGELVAYVAAAVGALLYLWGSVRIARGAKRRAVARGKDADWFACWLPRGAKTLGATPAIVYWLLAVPIAAYHVLRVTGKAGWWLVPHNAWRLLCALNRAVEGKPKDGASRLGKIPVRTPPAADLKQHIEAHADLANKTARATLQEMERKWLAERKERTSCDPFLNASYVSVDKRVADMAKLMGEQWAAKAERFKSERLELEQRLKGSQCGKCRHLSVGYAQGSGGIPARFLCGGGDHVAFVDPLCYAASRERRNSPCAMFEPREDAEAADDLASESEPAAGSCPSF